MGLISNGTTIFDAGALDSGLAKGAMTFIKKIALSSAAGDISFVNGASGVVLDSTYKEYVFFFHGIHPATDGVTFSFQGSTNTGSAYGVTTTNAYFNSYHSEGGAAALNYESASDIAQGTGEISLIRENKLSADADHSGNGILTLYNPSSTTFVKHYISHYVHHYTNAAPGEIDNFMAGYCNTTTAIDGVQFKMDSGNIDAGDICLYGIA